MVKKADNQSQSPFGYRLVDRKPKAGVVIAVVFVLIMIIGFFYSFGTGVHH